MKFDITKLICYGCSHSIGNLEYPGAPSGERPCLFCIRNPNQAAEQKAFEERTGHKIGFWYDGSPAIKVPMDCYHPLDMIDQMMEWGKHGRGEAVAPGSLEEYFKLHYKQQIIDFALRISIDKDGEISFYIHPDGKDGKTNDYVVRGNKLIPEESNVRT